MVLHINELTLRKGKSGFKRGLGGRREAVEGTLSPEQSAVKKAPRSSVKEAPTDGRAGGRSGRSGARGAGSRSPGTEKGAAGSVSGPLRGKAGALPCPCSRTASALPLWPA